MSTPPPSPGFIIAVRKLLLGLYDSAVVRASPLVAWLGADQSATPTPTLQKIIADEIQALKPSYSVPVHAGAWRTYHILTYRFVEQLSQKEVAAEMLLSVRQLRRLEDDAVEELASALWSKYDIASKVPADPPPNVSAPADTPQNELDWLKESFPSEVIDLGSLLAFALQTCRPLAEAAASTIKVACPDDLPPVEGPLVPTRQVVLDLLMEAIGHAHGGAVRVTAQAASLTGRAVVLTFESRGGLPPGGSSAPGTPESDTSENVKVTHSLVALINGQLELPASSPDGAAAGATAFNSRLTLPMVSQVAVLAVDDNADALQLVRRYLAGSRYRFIGIRDPALVMETTMQTNPSVILLDVMLPRIDGWELLGRLRSHPRTAHIPVIICTFLAQEPLVKALGAAHYLRKPIMREELLAVLGQVVQMQLPQPPQPLH